MGDNPDTSPKKVDARDSNPVQTAAQEGFTVKRPRVILHLVSNSSNMSVIYTHITCTFSTNDTFRLLLSLVLICSSSYLFRLMCFRLWATFHSGSRSSARTFSAPPLPILSPRHIIPAKWGPFGGDIRQMRPHNVTTDGVHVLVCPPVEASNAQTHAPSSLSSQILHCLRRLLHHLHASATVYH